MKQHITIEQLKERSALLFTNLPSKYFRELASMERREDGYVSETYFTVGKMIEIISFYESSYTISHCEGEYCITLDRGMGGIEIPTNCLCDSLWEAVKELIS